MAMLAGVVLATGALYIITDRPPAATVAIGVMTGMIVGQAVWTAVRR